MFKGFKIEEINFQQDIGYYLEIGQKMYDEYKLDIRKSFKSFLLKDNSLDGTDIIETWFPQFNANVFISHSHKDEKEAIAFAGWLYENFKIKSFIDSCIWGYSKTLNKMLDDVYSWIDKANGIYGYDEVLHSAGHVHMMISTALSNMIDKTECLMFYNTPNSVKSYNATDKTESPWIYSEITFSQIVRQTIPERKKTISVSEHVDNFEKALSISYDLNSKHLTYLKVKTLNKWAESSGFRNTESALDKLYDIALPRIDLID